MHLFSYCHAIQGFNTNSLMLLLLKNCHILWNIKTLESMLILKEKLIDRKAFSPITICLNILINFHHFFLHKSRFQDFQVIWLIYQGVRINQLICDFRVILNIFRWILFDNIDILVHKFNIFKITQNFLIWKDGKFGQELFKLVGNLTFSVF